MPPGTWTSAGLLGYDFTLSAPLGSQHTNTSLGNHPTFLLLSSESYH